MFTYWVKYCKKLHNIALDGPTVQLGTLEYYRTMVGGKLIPDPGEATARRVIRRDREDSSVPLTRGQTAVAFGSGISVQGPGGDVILEQIHPNCYVFCVTECSAAHLPSPAEGRSWDDDYNSLFVIRELAEFAAELRAELSLSLNRGLFAEREHLWLERIPISERGYELGYKIVSVDYVASREEWYASPRDVTVPFDDVVATAPFRKPADPYAVQREARIIFRLTCNNNVVAMRPAPILLPSGRLRRFVSVPSDAHLWI